MALVDTLINLVRSMAPGDGFVWAEETTEVAELVRLGLVHDCGGDRHIVTKAAMRMLTPAQTYSNPIGIMRYRASLQDAFEMGPMELLFSLMDTGWVEENSPKTKKLAPYTSGSPRKIYYSFSGGLTRFYLLALHQSDKLFAKGVQAIFYFQSEEYYKTLIYADGSQAPSIKPHQKASEFLCLNSSMHNK